MYNDVTFLVTLYQCQGRGMIRPWSTRLSCTCPIHYWEWMREPGRSYRIVLDRPWQVDVVRGGVLVCHPCVCIQNHRLGLRCHLVRRGRRRDHILRTKMSCHRQCMMRDVERIGMMLLKLPNTDR